MIFLHYEISRRNEKPSAVYFCSVRAKDGNRIVHFQILLRLTLLKVRKYSQVYPFSMNHSLKVACVIVTCDTINLFFFLKKKLESIILGRNCLRTLYMGRQKESVCLIFFFQNFNFNLTRYLIFIMCYVLRQRVSEEQFFKLYILNIFISDKKIKLIVYKQLEKYIF